MGTTATLHTSVTRGQPVPAERRREVRQPAAGQIWLLDHRSAMAIPCQCRDMSPSGLCVRAPLGYGLAKGRTYELCSHRPGQATPPGLGLIISRRGSVVRTRIVVADDERDDELELGIALEPARRMPIVAATSAADAMVP